MPTRSMKSHRRWTTVGFLDRHVVSMRGVFVRVVIFRRYSGNRHQGRHMSVPRVCIGSWKDDSFLSYIAHLFCCLHWPPCFVTLCSIVKCCIAAATTLSLWSVRAYMLRSMLVDVVGWPAGYHLSEYLYSFGSCCSGPVRPCDGLYTQSARAAYGVIVSAACSITQCGQVLLQRTCLRILLGYIHTPRSALICCSSIRCHSHAYIRSNSLKSFCTLAPTICCCTLVSC